MIGAPAAAQAERVYVAERGSAAVGDARAYVEEGGHRRPVRHVVYHSPSGYEWSYDGSGPAGLSLSILADYFGEQPTREQLDRGEPRCWRLHQPFKWAFIAAAPHAGFRLPERAIAAWLEERQEKDDATAAP